MSGIDSPDLSNPYRSPNEGRVAPPSPSSLTAEWLRQTRPWVKFLGIAGFIVSGLMLLAAAVMLIAAIATGGGAGMPMVQAVIMAVFYVAFAVLYIFPSLYLLRYASRISTFLEDGTTQSLDAALETQKSFWKFVGIMMAIIMGLYGVMLVVGVIIGIVIAVWQAI